MYINKIDELIDKIMDDFYSVVIAEKSRLDKVFGDPNFVKYQKEINDMLLSYEDKIDRKSLNKVLDNADSVQTIVEIIMRYLGYYTFLTIGFNYTKPVEAYINNVVEFSRNQPTFKLKIDNFFNSENNSILISLYELMKAVTELVNADPQRLTTLSKRPEYELAIEFLNTFGQEYVTHNFKLDNLKGNAKDQSHNIIKTIILNELYFKEDKKYVFDILEAVEHEKGEYMFIDIVVPKSDYLDITVLENILPPEDVQQGLATEIYDLVVNNEDISQLEELSVDEKILQILNSRVVVPISEDFLLYHKDSERYEKVISGPKQKKKEDTRIKYSVSKIDTASELYSKSAENPKIRKEIERKFYPPLADRKGVLINNSEEVKIINKLHNQGRKSIEGNEQYNDLMNYRIYPYINFKDLSKDGFSIHTTETIDAMRYVTLQAMSSSKRDVQLRTSADNMVLNVVGLLIPTNNIHLHCLTDNMMTDIRTLKNKSGKRDANGYNSIVKMIRKVLYSDKSHGSAYWLFDLSLDKTRMDKYEQTKKLTQNQQMKLVIANLYDDIVKIMYGEIIKRLVKQKQVPLYKFHTTIKAVEADMFEFPKDSKEYDELKQMVYKDLYIKRKAQYDKREDVFPGLSGDIMKLPSAEPPKKSKLITISLREAEEKEEEESVDSNISNAVCQHNMDWEKMIAIRKKNPNQFEKLMFEFVNQYVIENHDGDYVCRSCGTQVNIKKFVADGQYNEEGRFVAFNSAMEVNLEDIPEYEKYKYTIRALDKLVEQLATTCSMPYFVGNSGAIKSRRRAIVKNVLDLLLIHNKQMKSVYRERSNKITNLYGVNRDWSNLFIFELDNSIFVHSTKDKDQYKPIKRNNVLIYTLFIMLLELNNSQVLLMKGDKICNYYWFEKFGYNLFQDLKIRKNNKDDIVPLQNYKTLCYILFYTSCLITRHRIWFTDDQVQKKKFDPIVQKAVIHSLVDFMNSIVEFYSEPDRHYMYDMVAMRLFNKLQTVFNNDEILELIAEMEKDKITIKDGKVRYVSTKIKSIMLRDYQHGDYQGEMKYPSCRVADFQPESKDIVRPTLYNISNVTNCELGTFHNWKAKDDTMECTICSKRLDIIEPDAELTEKIIKKYYYTQLRVLAKQYCKSGELHSFVYDNKLKCDICKKCKLINVDKLKETELDELERNINRLRDTKARKEIKFENKVKDVEDIVQKKTDAIIKQLKSEYGNTKRHREDYFRHVEVLVKDIEQLIGQETKIHGKDEYLVNDAYVIDHDHNGYDLKQPFTIIDRGNKIKFISNHNFFKTDVIYYTNTKIGRIDVFYDSTTLLLLGYQERNHEPVHAKQKNRHLHINYSILNKLRMMGYNSKWINIRSRVKELKKYHNKDDQELIINRVVSDIARDRIKNLKKAITDIQRILYRIKYDYEDVIEDEIVERYREKLGKMNLRGQDKKDKVFRSWRTVKYNVFFQDISDKTVNLSPTVKYIASDDVSDYDYHGNLILFYIIREIQRLLNLNTNRFIKTTIVYMIFDIVNQLHNKFNEEYQMTNFEVKRFKYIISSKKYVHDVMEQGHGLEGFYGEYTDDDDKVDDEKLEQLETDQEEIESLDVDGELDYEIDYEAGKNLS